MRMKLVEYVKKVALFDDEGDEIGQRSVGDRMRVDAASARSLVEVKKVAKYVDTSSTPAAAKKTPQPAQPEPEGDH